MRYQNWSFIIALMLLLGIMVLKRTMGGSLLVLVALVYTMVRTARLRTQIRGKGRRALPPADCGGGEEGARVARVPDAVRARGRGAG